MSQETRSTPDLDNIFGKVREMAGQNPATQRLFEEAEQYVRNQGKQLMQNMGEGGGIGSSALSRGLRELAQGGSPMKALGESALGALSGFGKGGGGKKGGGRAKATVISENLDVGVPVSTAYNQWTQFTEMGDYLKGVEGVEQRDDSTTSWRTKVGLFRRMFEGHITEQIPDRRISWDSSGPKGTTKGVVTFHPLCDDLTRICVVIEYFPGGFVEKVGNMFHLVGRRVRLDLQLYRRNIMMRGEESGAWRGEIRDGQVVRRRRSAA